MPAIPAANRTFSAHRQTICVTPVKTAQACLPTADAARLFSRVNGATPIASFAATVRKRQATASRKVRSRGMGWRSSAVPLGSGPSGSSQPAALGVRLPGTRRASDLAAGQLAGRLRLWAARSAEPPWLVREWAGPRGSRHSKPGPRKSAELQVTAGWAARPLLNWRCASGRETPDLYCRQGNTIRAAP